MTLQSLVVTLGLLGFSTTVHGHIDPSATGTQTESGEIEWGFADSKARRRVKQEATPDLRRLGSKKGGYNMEFAKKYVNKITGGGMFDHLNQFQLIADANNNNGNRAAGMTGYQDSVDYVTMRLSDAGYSVYNTLVSFPFSMDELSPPSLMSPDTVMYDMPPNTDETFYVMPGTNNGPVTAPVTAVHVDYDPAATHTSGCAPEDFEGFPEGNIAFIQRGSCAFVTKYANAIAAGAVGIIITNEGNTDERMDAIDWKGAWLNEDTGAVIFFASAKYGMALLDAMAGGEVSLTMEADVDLVYLTAANVLAETSAGNPDEKIVMIGAHLDSVQAGSGINDDGSGSTAVLELALQLKENGWDNDDMLKRKVRFGWWAAEELGLLGSTAYVEGLNDADIEKIGLYLNVDMIGSPNFVRLLMDGDGSHPDNVLEVYEGMPQLEQTLRDYFDGMGIAYEETLAGTRSDHAAFYNAGIPITFMFTGAEVVKSEEQAAVFGGVAGESFDQCYHQECDRIDNVNLMVLEELARGMAYVAAKYASTAGNLWD